MVLVVSGCALNKTVNQPTVVGGISEYVNVPKGTVIKDLPLPIAGGKADYVTPSDMQLVTLDAWDIIEAQCGGSAPKPASTDSN